jgi:hypothetical protein
MNGAAARLAAARVLSSSAMKAWHRLGLALWLVGCKDATTPAADDGDSMCVGAKCDELDDGTGSTDTGADTEPPDDIAMTCGRRRDDAFNPNKYAFEADALRWSCDDVPEVYDWERGQEYCEYFAVVQVPGAAGPEVLGKNLGADPESGQTPLQLELDADAIAQLEADPSAVVGHCVFSAWNSDEPQPGCTAEPCQPVDEVSGLPVLAEDFRMKFDVNSTEAAVNILHDCLDFIPDAGDPDDPNDPLHDDFLRACRLNAEINETQWRKSDNILCAATVRLAECGCGLSGTDALDFPDVLPRPSPLGFVLGTWTGRDELPGGCRYVDPGDGSRHLVACELTAAEVITNASELKAYCAEAYAPNVVVHVPIDGAAIECKPVDGDPYTSTCPAEPWRLEG